MAIKKSQLYASLWQSCDELRGGMDASQYKDYILTLLFMKYVSDKAENDPYALITVPEGGGFSDMVALNCFGRVGPSRKAARGHPEQTGQGDSRSRHQKEKIQDGPGSTGVDCCTLFRR